MPLSLGTPLPMRRAAMPPRAGAPGRGPRVGAEAGARRGGGGMDLSESAAFLSAAVAASTEMVLFGARLAN